MFLFGIDTLLNSPDLLKRLHGKRVALLAHPASVTSKIQHSLNALIDSKKLNITAAFGPQHGMRGEKQDNMIESEHYQDPETGVQVFSLYSEVRRPTTAMMDTFDVLLIDLQDVGCRVYTYLTTLLYFLEECATHKKAIWVLDRPNPAGRPVEGFLLEKSLESYVGAARVPLRHGLTLGEMALYLRDLQKLNVEVEVIAMQNYRINERTGYGWPEHEVSWVNPSPNMPTICTARCYAGTVLLEGTNLSEGRGTTRPLQIFGAPGIDAEKILKWMQQTAPQWLKGCILRPCFFEPTFHKFKSALCSGFQIHVDAGFYDHQAFRPYRLMLLFFKALTELQPEIFAWRQPPYEYETVRLPIDLLNGHVYGREWVDDSEAHPEDLEKRLAADESEWLRSIKPHLLY